MGWKYCNGVEVVESVGSMVIGGRKGNREEEVESDERREGGRKKCNGRKY